MFRLTILATLALALPAAPSSASGDVADLREALGSEAASERIDAIEALAKSESGSASSLVARMLRDSSPEVRAAAARALGARGDRTALAALRWAADELDDDPTTLAAVCAGLGATGSRAAVEPLGDVARQEMSRRPRVARAAIEALGAVRDPESVETLLGLLSTATPSQTDRTTNTGQRELLAPIRASLRRLTGQRLVSSSAWSAWWRRNERGYRFPEDPGAELRGKVFREEGFLFRVERPSTKAWEFARPDGNGLLLVRFTGPREASPVAYVMISGYSVKEFDPDTPDALARRYAARMEDEYADFRDRVTDRPARLGGENAIYQRFFGRTRKGIVLETRHWIARRGEHVFTVRAVLASGSSERVRRELDSIVKSFRFLDD
jgi:hypothetical protein